MSDHAAVQERIGDAIRVYARARKVPLKQLYRDLGMSKASFFSRLRGSTAMSIEDLSHIAELLNVGIADLLEPPSWVAGESNPEPAGSMLVSGVPASKKVASSTQGAARSDVAA